MPSYHIPYRGDGNANKYKYSSRHDATEKTTDEGLWFAWFIIILGAIAVCVGSFAFANGSSFGIAIFFIYLMFFVVWIAAVYDSKNIKKITLEIKDDKELDEKDGPPLAEDYFAQIAWLHTHRRRHHSSRWDAPEPQWRYQRLEASNRRTTNSCLLTLIIYGLVILVSVVVGSISQIFGANAPIIASTLIVLGVAGIGIYLIGKN